MWNNWTVELSLERIANLSSKASPIDRRTSRRREEDDPLGDESPPLESVGRVSGSFILRSAQQGEALHRIWYALRRWRLVSRRIVLFPTTACSSINRR
ncbi:unnamed protein product [Spirodela intermedia]|uniref:Uncharacterized protein n=1 Tax=Spirodela intermedia TaxID=51605 RepID=A0A7I8LCM6_SPIIN|nr:unnamed protein product [Spirodela intermedia]